MMNRFHHGVWWRLIVAGVVAITSSIGHSSTYAEELESVQSVEDLEALLEAQPESARDIVPKLEAAILNEIVANGPAERFVIKAEVAASGSVGSVTLRQPPGGQPGVLLAMEFPGDSVPVSFGSASSSLSTVPRGHGSIHRFYGQIRASEDYTLLGEGNESNRLTFCLIRGVGLVYMRGKGKAIKNDGSELVLGG